LDSTVTAAVIGAGATIAAAIFTGIVTWLKVRKTAHAEAQKIGEGLGNAKSVEYAYSVTEHEARVSFDEDGNGTYVRRVSGIVPRQTVTNLCIPYSFGIASPGGRLLGNPDAKELDGSELPAEVQEIELTDTQVTGVIKIAGTFHRGVTGEGFRLTQPFEKGCCLTRKQAQAAYKNDPWPMEYLAALVSVPTTTLRIVVEFPPSHHEMRPKPSAVVFVGDTETAYPLGVEALKGKVAFDAGVATLAIQDPKLGFRYGITWMPPDRALPS
jgi:hypothetical protein